MENARHIENVIDGVSRRGPAVGIRAGWQAETAAALRGDSSPWVWQVATIIAPVPIPVPPTLRPLSAQYGDGFPER
ncbi:hypothetical protein MB27_10080 [Actinoplanes utahensis]|uniref:Uncharacterized protein n=1 Tax=Actinoplanes utahensis TaxID=1869 RepID=A0A0A6UPU7_ACTUT|nr:hypothetical protein MB27_10080 [Actinoplanes utahensis]